MDSAFASVGLPIALGVIMFGLGLSLTADDFRGVRKAPKAVAVALVCQLLVLPFVCFGIVLLLDLPAVLAVGILLLAASPGGPTANIYSHLFRGDVALNITLTAVNSVLAILTLPLVTTLALRYFDMTEQVDLQFGKVIEVFAVVLIPVIIGMIVKANVPVVADRLERPFRVASALLLVALIVAIVLSERDNLGEYLGSVGLAATLFCIASLTVGYLVPRATGVRARQAVACSFEIGVHNATLAIYVAVEVIGSVAVSVPAATYGLLMFPIAAVWGVILTRWLLPPEPAEQASARRG